MANMREFTKTTGESLSKEQKQMLRRVFNEMDGNHNGRLCEREIQLSAKKIGLLVSKDDIKKIMKDADLDGNGWIEYKEFEETLGVHLLMAEYKNKQLREMFGQIDKDGNGYITKDELKLALHESGCDMTDDEVTELFKEADTNRDGKISFEEFSNSVFE